MKLEIFPHELAHLLWLQRELHAQDNGSYEHPIYDVGIVFGGPVVETFLTAFMARKFIEDRPDYASLSVLPREGRDNPEIRFLRELLMAKRWSSSTTPIAPGASDASRNVAAAALEELAAKGEGLAAEVSSLIESLSALKLHEAWLDAANLHLIESSYESFHHFANQAASEQKADLKKMVTDRRSPADIDKLTRFKATLENI